MTTSHWFKARIHDLDAGECRELLLNHGVGRIVFDDDHGPTALPVIYVVSGEDIVFATRSDGEIARHATQPSPWAEGSRQLLLRIRPMSLTGRRLIPT